MICRPAEVHHNFSPVAFQGVLQRAAQKRKYIREDKSMEKLDRNISMVEKRVSNLDGGHDSRSNSQLSNTPSGYPLNQPSVSGIMGKDVAIVINIW